MEDRSIPDRVSSQTIFRWSVLKAILSYTVKFMVVSFRCWSVGIVCVVFLKGCRVSSFKGWLVSLFYFTGDMFRCVSVLLLVSKNFHEKMRFEGRVSYTPFQHFKIWNSVLLFKHSILGQVYFFFCEPKFSEGEILTFSKICKFRKQLEKAGHHHHQK